MTNQPDTWKEELPYRGTPTQIEEFVESLLSTRTALAQKEGVREAMRVVEERFSFYEKEKKENLERDNIMIAYDMDSRWVATKQILQALEELIGKV